MHHSGTRGATRRGGHHHSRSAANKRQENQNAERPQATQAHNSRSRPKTITPKPQPTASCCRSPTPPLIFHVVGSTGCLPLKECMSIVKTEASWKFGTSGFPPHHRRCPLFHFGRSSRAPVSFFRDGGVLLFKLPKMTSSCESGRVGTPSLSSWVVETCL